MSRLVLISSPFVGAISWRATAAALPDSIAYDFGGVSAPDWYEGVARRIVAQCDESPWIAVLHSGAGGFAPAIASAATRLAGLIFVDAVLPYPGKNYIETASADFIARLRRLTHDGYLAPWNRWFEADPLPRLVPDAATREAFKRDLPRVPSAFLEVVSPDTSEWENLPAAYVQLSKAYDEEAAEAERRGWTMRRAKLHHLAMTSEPTKVAELLSGLP
jgi:hypothetical protein